MVKDVDSGGLTSEDIEKEERAAFGEIDSGEALEIPPQLEFIRDIPMRVSVETGRSTLTVRDLLRMNVNQIIEMDKMVGEPLEIRINDQLVARGEVVVINDRFGIRLTDIINPLEQGLQN